MRSGNKKKSDGKHEQLDNYKLCAHNNGKCADLGQSYSVMDGNNGQFGL